MKLIQVAETLQIIQGSLFNNFQRSLPAVSISLKISRSRRNLLNIITQLEFCFDDFYVSL